MLNPILINSVEIHGVQVYNIVEVYDALGLVWNQNIEFQTWAQANNLDYYAQTRENFNEFDAARIAKTGNYYGVVVEDLS